MSKMLQRQRLRPYIWTGAVAAITATGVWYGAGLKIRQDFKQEKEVRRSATPAEQIALLEAARSGLVARKLGLEKRIADLKAKKNSSSSKTVDSAVPLEGERGQHG